MKDIGYNQPLYILPFDHRGSFETKMFGWHGDLTAEITRRSREFVGIFKKSGPA